MKTFWKTETHCCSNLLFNELEIKLCTCLFFLAFSLWYDNYNNFAAQHRKNVNLVTIFQNLNQQKIVNWVVYHMAYRHTLLTSVRSRFEFQVSNQTKIQLWTQHFHIFCRNCFESHQNLIFFLIHKVKTLLNTSENDFRFRISNFIGENFWLL